MTYLTLLLFPKNLDSWSSTKSGRSSGIQCTESGTVTPVTFVANYCNELNAKLPGTSPPNAG
jgi:hypothetical protein